MKIYLPKTNIELMIKYINDLSINEDDEKEMNRIILDKEILDLLRSIFYYN